jgi:hypothetical protein
MMKYLVSALFLVACAAGPVSAGELQLSIQDGRVSLDAQDVTVRQILTEWERIGKTRIVNAERIVGGLVTLKLDRVPEKQALDIILRTVPGYMAVPRETVVADASVYDRILIMATTTAVAAARPAPAATSAAGSRGGFPALATALQSGANITQLRQAMQAAQAGQAEPPDPADDQADDPAIAAAAAAGLVAVPAQNPGPVAAGTAPAGTAPFAPLAQPQQPQSDSAAPDAAAPSNPWNAPAGTSRPSLAPPPPTPSAPPPIRPRPPQPDR